jgi:hypothetical protein
MNDWSDTPIYAQMMADLEAKERVETPIYYQLLEETKQKEKLMEDMQRKVIAMRNAMDLPVPDKPRTLSAAEAQLHIRMIRDEFEKEFVPAFLKQDLVEMYDAGIDVLVYLMGAMSNAGFDIEPGFNEIMRSNMSKMDPETGKAIKAVANDPSGEPEGKVLKGPAYSPPSLEPIINAQFAYGPVDNTVYRTQKTPILLGIKGPKIGEGDLYMDHNGNLDIEGVIFDVDILPQIQALSILDAAPPAVAERVKAFTKAHEESIINLDEVDPDANLSDYEKGYFTRKINQVEGLVEDEPAFFNYPSVLGPRTIVEIEKGQTPSHSTVDEWVDGAYPIPGNMAHAIKFDRGVQ